MWQRIPDTPTFTDNTTDSKQVCRSFTFGTDSDNRFTYLVVLSNTARVTSFIRIAKSAAIPSISSSMPSSAISTSNPSCCDTYTICLPSISGHITSSGMPASRVKSSKDTWGLTVALSSNASVREMTVTFDNC